MIGLFVLVSVIVWSVICWKLARWMTRAIERRGLRVGLFVIALALLFIAPLTDEIIGKFQFDRLCRAADQVHIYGKIPAGEELYTPDGRWKIGMDVATKHSSQIRAEQDFIYSLLRYERSPIRHIDAAIPIREYRNRIYDRRTEKLLAEYKFYGTSGGWVSRNFETPGIVRAQCFPKEHDFLTRNILPFKNK